MERLRSLAKGRSFTAKRYEEEVRLAVLNLTRGIPPIEVPGSMPGMPNPISSLAILNAGWEVYKTKRSEFYDLFDSKIPLTDRLLNLNKLLFKAVESAEVVRTFHGI